MMHPELYLTIISNNILNVSIFTESAVLNNCFSNSRKLFGRKISQFGAMYLLLESRMFPKFRQRVSPGKKIQIPWKVCKIHTEADVELFKNIRDTERVGVWIKIKSRGKQPRATRTVSRILHLSSVRAAIHHTFVYFIFP